MKVSLLKEDKIEQIVKYCMRIFEQERAECFVYLLITNKLFLQTQTHPYILHLHKLLLLILL